MNPFRNDVDRARAEAADWIARRDAGLDAASERAFLDWLGRAPSHRAAWEEADRAWNAFTPAADRGTGEAMVLELARRRRARQLRRRSTLLACTALALLSVAWWYGRPGRPPAAIAQTVATRQPRVTHPESQRLEDGTAVELNANTRIAVEYTASQRTVRLLSGEAHFTVVHNAARPFRVIAGDIAVQDVGTQFAVRLRADAADILVTEGQVRVDGTSTDTPTALMEAGDRLSVPLSGKASAPLVPQRATAAETQSWLAWRGPRLVLADTSLAEAIAALNSENTLKIEISDASLAQMRLSGVFRADNAEGFVRLLESGYGIRVERRPGLVLLKGPVP